MYCHSCGTKTAEDATYCTNCGEKIVAYREEQVAETTQMKMDKETEVIQTTDQGEEKDQSRSKNLQVNRRILLSSVLVWGIPLVSLLSAGGGVYAYYLHEKETNQTVLHLKEEAETKATEGKYEEASKLVHEALNLRPDYKILKENESIIEVAAAYEGSLKKTDELIKQQKYDEVSSEINKLKKELQSQEGPLFEPLLVKISDKETTLTIAKVKTEIKNLNEVDELASKLSSVSDLKAKEAAGVAAEIKEKIVKVSVDEAEEYLKSNDFSSALAAIDEALEYAKDNKKLLSFRGSIESQQAAFEQAEQQRIEKAMEAAAQEDLKNQTSAVEVLYLDAVVDEYGDLNIFGEVKNTASRSISSVTISFTIYDEAGNYLDDGITSVYPYDLAPNEVGVFDEVYYGVNQNVEIVTDQVNWYLN